MLPSVAVLAQATEVARMSRPEPEVRLRRREFVPVGFYKIVMTLSLLVNVLLAASLWNYGTIETAIAKAQTASGHAK